MEVEQNWVIENIDIMMKVFMKINGPMSKQNKSKHKQNMLKNGSIVGTKKRGSELISYFVKNYC